MIYKDEPPNETKMSPLASLLLTKQANTHLGALSYLNVIRNHPSAPTRSSASGYLPGVGLTGGGQRHQELLRER